MLNRWRQPAAVWLAIFAMGASALLPAQLLADCCCQPGSLVKSSCCQPQAEHASACCCSVKSPDAASCCSSSKTSAPADSCGLPDGSSCECTACGATLETTPATMPRSDDSPRIDLNFFAIPTALLPVTTVVGSTWHFPAPGEGYLPSPVRERLCVWTI